MWFFVYILEIGSSLETWYYDSWQCQQRLTNENHINENIAHIVFEDATCSLEAHDWDIKIVKSLKWKENNVLVSDRTKKKLAKLLAN